MKILMEFSEYLSISNLLVYIWRKFAWAVLMGVKSLLDGVESVLNAVYKLVDFGDSEEIKSFITTNNIAIYAVGTLCLLFFFILKMQNSKKTSMKTLVNNILLGLGVILLCTTLTYQITKGSMNVAKAIYSGNSTMGDQIFNDNIYDVTTFDSFNWESKKKVKSINYEEDSLKSMDITAEVFPKKLAAVNPVTTEVFNNKINIDTEGNRELAKLDRGMFQMDENYYRYSWHPWIIFFQLFSMIIVLFAASFKYTKSIFNAFYNGIIAPFFAFSDLVETSKVQKIITGIVNTGINMILFAMSLMLYRLLSAYAGTMGVNAIQQVFIQLFLAFIVVEGPFIIQELTGQDGGVRSEAKALAGSAVGAAFMGSKAGKALKNGFDNVKDKVKKGASFAAGAGQGVMDAGKDTLEEEMNAAKEDNAQPEKPSLDPANEMSPEEKEAFDQEVKQDLSKPNTSDSLTPEGASEDNSDLKDTRDSLNGPKPIAGLEDISATPPVLDKEMDQAKQEGAVPGVSSIHSPIPEGALAKADPFGNEPADSGNGLSLNSQKAIQSAVSGGGNHMPKPTVSPNGMPASIQSMPGVHEAQQGGFIAPMSQPSSARMAQLFSAPAISRAVVPSSLQVSSQAPVRMQAAIPAAIQSMPGVQQYKQDLKNSEVPVTRETLPEIIGNKIADRQIKKAEERKVYQRYNQIGRNTTKNALDKFTPRKERDKG